MCLCICIAEWECANFCPVQNEEDGLYIGTVGLERKLFHPPPKQVGGRRLRSIDFTKCNAEQTDWGEWV